MKKLAALFVVPLIFSACGSEGNLPNNRPYTITIKPLGYKYDSGKFTITESVSELHSAAGAPDVRSIDYTAVLLDSKGNPAGYNQSYIVPQTGTLFGHARGGYVCTTTPANICSMGRSDAVLTETGPLEWSENSVIRTLVPVEWAIIHLNASTGASDTPPGGDTAGWYVEFTFRAVEANGKVVQWKQNYQFVSPS